MVKNKTRYRVLRASVGLSQMDTAIKAKMSQRKYWRIENGYDVPTDAERAALARVFKVTAEEVPVAS